MTVSSKVSYDTYQAIGIGLGHTPTSVDRGSSPLAVTIILPIWDVSFGGSSVDPLFFRVIINLLKEYVMGRRLYSKIGVLVRKAPTKKIKVKIRSYHEISDHLNNTRAIKCKDKDLHCVMSHIKKYMTSGVSTDKVNNAREIYKVMSDRVNDLRSKVKKVKTT